MIKNVFIVGAAKSGTTSLHNYLSQHKDICMSSPKEPKYFSYNTGIKNYNGPGDSEVLSGVVKTAEHYSSIYGGVDPHQLVYGESSADNLYYSLNVVPAIKKYNKDSKIIILLRNPVDRALSAYSHLRRDGREKLSFKEALSDENKRINKGWEFIWHYKKAGLYFNDVKRYSDNFSNVKVIIFDDFINDCDAVMDGVFEFLNVKKITIDKIRYNKSGIVRSSTIKKIINSNSLISSLLKKMLKLVIPKTKRKKFIVFIENLNLKNNKPNTETEIELLKEFFKEDIQKLELLLDIELSGWK